MKIGALHWKRGDNCMPYALLHLYNFPVHATDRESVIAVRNTQILQGSDMHWGGGGQLLYMTAFWGR